jgi:radical SAM protein with 4Fe4S-binding SPASM domain
MKQVVLPPKFRMWSKGDWHIYFDPYNFAWVRVNDSGKFLMDLFARHRTIKEISEIVVSKFSIPFDKAQKAIVDFVESIVKSGFMHYESYKEKEKDEFPPIDFPHDIYVHLTNKCNLKCPYCYNKDDRENKIYLEKVGMVDPTLSTEEFKSLISRIIDCGVSRILFTGGEPLMRHDVLELISFTREYSKKVQIEILTNAILITDEIAEHLCKNVDAVTISLDGHEKHLHEFYRGKNTFSPTVRGIKRLVKKRKEIGYGPYIATVPAVTNYNLINLKDIFKFSLDDLGVDGLAPIIFQAGDHQAVSITQIPDLDVYIEEMSGVQSYLRERQSNKSNSETETAPLIGKRNHCGVGNGEISTDPSGYVYPCQSLHFDEFICGNVREDDIKDIFHNSPVMKKVRGTTVDSISVCTHCDIKYLCNAGCRATSYNVYREFDSHNEIYCKFLETLSVEKLWGTSTVSLSPK